ncbi:hypothetical protein GALMADRAFT_60342 [Galerina marginata CBS 339.88]|uniref:Non-structural maintenance of chromosomes element 1 homolog n=1 Tax=Galerina marginata (strain CBS 339.88) TaxID=685588 RepID=A0A067TGS7_GALM3|nr:hypothetical protein GALMADRAFT_60342 [Galerina marginata CBS 339.88]
MVSPSDVDRLFLQAVLSRGIMSSNLAKILWEKSVKAVNASDNTLNIRHSKDDGSWQEFVGKINKSLDKLDLEFRTLHDELSGREMYALVNRKGDEIAQMATDYTPVEITFFKAILEQIMLAPNESYSVSSLAALRELNAAKLNMTKSQAEVVLASFVSKGWLLKSKLGRYSLSTRSLLELLPYLKSTYPDEIIECTVCMEGVACHTPNCKTRLHFHCFNNYRRRHSGCPSCNIDWPREAKDKPLMPVGEDAAREGDDRKRRTRAENSDEDSSDEGEQPSQTQDTPPKKGARRQTKKKVERDNSMEVDEDDDEGGNVQASQKQPTQTQGTQRTRRSTRR